MFTEHPTRARHRLAFLRGDASSASFVRLHTSTLSWIPESFPLLTLKNLLGGATPRPASAPHCYALGHKRQPRGLVTPGRWSRMPGSNPALPQTSRGPWLNCLSEPRFLRL